MNDEKYYAAKHLKITQKKLSTIQGQLEGFDVPAWKTEELIAEKHVLEDLENFLWKMLGDEQ